MSQHLEKGGRGFDEGGIDLKLYLPVVKRWAAFAIGVGIIAFGLSWLYTASLEAPPPTYTATATLVLQRAQDTDQYLALSRTLGNAMTASGRDGVINLAFTTNSANLAEQHLGRLVGRLENMAANVSSAQREALAREYELYKQAIIELTGGEPEGPGYFASRRPVLGSIISQQIIKPMANESPSVVRDHPLAVSLAVGLMAALAVVAVPLLTPRPGAGQRE